MNAITPLTKSSRQSAQSLAFDAEGMQALQRLAEAMSSARVTIPKHLAGSPGDCLAIVMQSAQWGMNPFAVAQKTHLVNGALGYEAQLVNAVISSSALLASRINYEWDGDWAKVDGKTDQSPERSVTVTATLAGEVRPRSLRVSMAQVGPVRNSPLWVADPRQQLAYLATKRWARLHAPDVLLGVYDTDEIAEKEITGDIIQAAQAAPITQPAIPALPTYTPEAFAANLGKWADLVQAGRKSAGDILAAISSKYELDAEQRAAIAALDQPQDDANADWLNSYNPEEQA